ncbi:DNA repair ATPase [Providencia rettgeri]|uniref:DNA repair ATPase n=1 Tax=Providencia rettgeri TaxID=587 RepID=UPI0030165C87
MSDIQDTDREQEILDSAVAEGGAYEILRKRLTDQGQQLHQKAAQLNEMRLDEFGQSQMDIIGRIRIRTENNCQARDIVRVGEWLLFGYNVFLGLKKETHLEDVFSLYRLIENDDEFDVEAVPYEDTFLSDNRFVQDFTELYTYYKNTQLLQLVEREGKLLASFQIGDRITDVRVFRWSISSDKRKIEYIDNRGERDIALPPAYDFEWQKTTREDTVNGRYPHINILDTVFIETIGGDLTIKCENNTEDGLGIYREAVLDKNQSLDDAQIEYAQTGSLIILKVLPYREETWRYLVYNTLSQSVQRIDAIGQACIQLPEDHGIIFPGGYYLQNGDYKTFEQPMDGMRFRRLRRSPNGEDVLYVFYSPNQGRIALFNYNLIERTLSIPLIGHGYAMLEDGKMVLFEGEGAEATRVHPMQVWQTPFYSEEFADQQPTRSGFLGRIGNADLVRGISEILHVSKEIEGSQISIARYEQLSQQAKNLLDLYYWFSDEQCLGIGKLLKEITQTSELVLDEYEKVESIRQQSAKSMNEAISRQKSLISLTLPESWADIQQFVDGLNALSAQRGHLISLREFRYMDLKKLSEMEAEIEKNQQYVSQETAVFLASDKALHPFKTQLTVFEEQIEKAQNSAQLDIPMKDMEKMSADLDMLSNLMASLSFNDVTQQTHIIDAISQIYAQLNQSRARLQQKRKSQSSVETVAQFGAQFRLFSQGIIQHTHPEFLQKFISLCDGTRRIEGVWKGKTKTYDMRGKKFCVVMAGNPYTESGEVFRIPDMLANRADIYNLGEVLGGMDEAFALSYIENSLTSNPVLAPLALRDLNDLYLFVDKSMGKSVSTNTLSYPYSDAEINEITSVISKLIKLRNVVLKVNQHYIASAAQSDKYRTEPVFRLQGSYRNMNKLSEKVSSVMNDDELKRVLDDHYLGEAQLLTTGAEENLLKLAELRGTLTEKDAARWQQIKKDFMRNKALGGDNADIGDRVVGQLASLVESVQALGNH